MSFIKSDSAEFDGLGTLYFWIVIIIIAIAAIAVALNWDSISHIYTQYRSGTTPTTTP